MKPVLPFLGVMMIVIFSGCSTSRKTIKPVEARTGEIHSSVVIKKKVPALVINTRNTSADAVVSFAETLIGVKYKYGSTIKENGFDCSGFITYVFNHFGIAVPRSSVDFTKVGVEIPKEFAGTGDLILFTGTDSTIRIVGHMGIVESNERGNLLFLHSTSGKAYGVVISPLNGYYETRFVKVIRVFSQTYFTTP
jgi:cell wall-associated NlpC family hydrolase